MNVTTQQKIIQFERNKYVEGIPIFSAFTNHINNKIDGKCFVFISCD